MATKAILAWSGGKDSALALHEVRRTGICEVVGLLTTITQDYDRVCMHGVRTALLEQQVAALELPLDKIYLTKDETQDGCDAKMLAGLTRCRQRGIETVVFGDIFLEDVRQYRENNLARVGMQAVFPLWHRETRELARSFVEAGFKAIVTCIDLHALTPAFAGRDYDAAFLADLPPAVDPCGEHGEFHSFVHRGPIFGQPVPFAMGHVITRENRFVYIDLAPRRNGS